MFGVIGLVGTALVIVVVWAIWVGPDTVWRVIAHGDTTVWDHTEYPGRDLSPSPQPLPWPVSGRLVAPRGVDLDGDVVALEEALVSSGTLALLVVQDGEIAYEWYAAEHSKDTPVMIFSVTKSLLSLLVGAAIDDGLITSVADPVTDYLPEMEGRGMADVSLRQLLTMDSSVAYVESDNPFGEHVDFNYTSDLTSAILALERLSEPESFFRYKSGDYAILSLVLDRVLDEESITGFLQRRLWDPLGAEGTGTWSTDHEGGLERAWCCLATTARDLARFGQLLIEDGVWNGERLISSDWIELSLSPAFGPDRWPAEYQEGPLQDYGYGWWQTTSGSWIGLGKDGQYLYVRPDQALVVVRQGESTGDFSWVELIDQLTGSAG